MKQPKSFPQELTVGNSRVTIYKVPNGQYFQFRVARYDSAGKRTFKTFATYDEARKTANEITGSINNGDVDAVVLTGSPKLEYARALQLLKPTGFTLSTAAEQFSNAWTALEGRSLADAVRYYVKTHPGKMARKSVSEVVTEFTKAKKDTGKSADYLTDIAYRCGRFADAFQCSIADITGAQVREFLANLTNTEGTRKGKPLSGRSVNNFKRLITTLFEFAKVCKYLPADWNELDGIDDYDEGDGPIEIYSPAELARLLNAASGDFLPALAIGAFAGLRAKELERITWLDVWDACHAGSLEVKAYRITAPGEKKRVAKTARRRLVPIQPNLAQWLAPYAEKTGPVWPHSEAWFEESKRITAAATEIKADPAKGIKGQAAVPWKHNGLRHSYISYRLEIVKSAAQVALECGNSPEKIFSNYRELVTEAAAKAWFSIAPDAAANVTPMVAAAP